jgi:hypothetical protein
MRAKLDFATARQTVLLLLIAGLSVAGQERTIVQPEDTGVGLVNPGMGWVFHHYDNRITDKFPSPNIITAYGVHLDPSDTVDEFPGVGVIYLRLAWSFLEPEEGKFNWAIVDTPAQRWINKGKQIAFRFTCAEIDETQPYATPRWVQEAGAKGHYYKGRQIVETGGNWEPDYEDPVFLEKLDHFLAAAAVRYDGNPEVAFIDVGSFGVYGEGHTGGSTKLPYSARTLQKHIDLHCKNFRNTLIAISDDVVAQGRGLHIIQYARDRGLTLRDDSIMVSAENPWHHAYLATEFWPRLPVILESQHYGPARDRGSWGDGHLYLKAIEQYHASYASVHWHPREFLTENRELIDRINRRIGYRLQLLEASWPSEMRRDEPLLVGYRWRNAGVAPCYPGGHPAITLKDAKGGIAGVFVDDDFDVRALPVGPPGEALSVSRRPIEAFPQGDQPLVAFQIPPEPVFKPGTYDVFVSVGSKTGTPRIALPLPGDDGHMRYPLGKVSVREALSAGPSRDQ